MPKLAIFADERYPWFVFKETDDQIPTYLPRSARTVEVTNEQYYAIIAMRDIVGTYQIMLEEMLDA